MKALAKPGNPCNMNDGKSYFSFLTFQASAVRIEAGRHGHAADARNGPDCGRAEHAHCQDGGRPERPALT